MSWGQAFLDQARSDDRVRRLLNAGGTTPYCHQLHYLQMSTEKLAKAYGTPPNGEPPPPVHEGLVNLLRLVRRSPDLRRRLGFGRDTASFDRFIVSLLPLARAIERLAPSFAGTTQPNPEYPWLDVATGRVVAPEAFAFPTFGATAQRMVRLQGLVDKLLVLDL